MNRGMFIAFEGIDGCGKTTQIKKFVQYLFDRDKHNHIVFTRNPYLDTNIRGILREDDNALSQAERLAELFIADRKKHSEEVVLPALAKGQFVVSDRFKLSTITYQAAQGIDIQKLINRHFGVPVPSITFVVDVCAGEAARRMALEGKRNEHKFEKDLVFLESVRQNYFKAKELLPMEKIFIVNGERSVEAVFNEVREIFEREFGKTPATGFEPVLL